MIRKFRRGGTKGQLLVARLHRQMKQRSLSPRDLFEMLDASGSAVVAGHDFRKMVPLVLPGRCWFALVGVVRMLVKGYLTLRRLRSCFKPLM